MRLSLSLSLGLLCGAVAASPIQARDEKDAGAATDVQIMINVLNNINGGVQRINKDITAWRGDAAGSGLLVSDAQYILQDMRHGAAAIAATTSINVLDATSLLNPIYNLNNNLDILVNHLIAKKTQFDTINKSTELRGQLTFLRAASVDLQKAIESKLPIGSSFAAQPVSASFTSKIDKAIAAYQPSLGSALTGALGGALGGLFGGSPAPAGPAPNWQGQPQQPAPLAPWQQPQPQNQPQWQQPGPQQGAPFGQQQGGWFPARQGTV